MYFVHYRNIPFGYNLSKFETINEAQEFVRDLASRGIREFYLSQEIPVKLKIEVEI